LPAELKTRLEQATATHDFNKFWENMRRRPGSGRGPMTEEQRRRRPPSVHPVFLTHPITERRVLYCNPGYAIRINELDQSESDRMLETLFAHQLQPKYQYTHRWTEGDVLVWDHIGTLHRAIADYGPDEYRLMKRCQVMANKIFDPAFLHLGVTGVEGAVPGRANAAQERRIDDQLAERVDEGHVQRRQAADAAHVHGEIEAVGTRRFDEGAQRGGVGGTVGQLEELLVLEAVHHSEGALARAGRQQGLRAIGGRQTGCEGLPHRGARLPIPTEESTDEETDVQEGADDRRRGERTRAGGPQELSQRDAGAPPWQIDGPHVVERHAGQKVMNPQGQPFELVGRDLWHQAFQASRPTSGRAPR
jgi:hypothetical protein